jgi:hypothetical protein
VLAAARNAKRRKLQVTNGSPGGAQDNNGSVRGRRASRAQAAPFKPGQLSNRQTTAEGRSEAFLRSFGILVEAVEAARLLTPFQFLHLLMALGRVLQPGFAPRHLAQTAMEIMAVDSGTALISADPDDDIPP